MDAQKHLSFCLKKRGHAKTPMLAMSRAASDLVFFLPSMQGKKNLSCSLAIPRAARPYICNDLVFFLVFFPENARKKKPKLFPCNSTRSVELTLYIQ
jgi:hypothetical protein